MQLTSASLGIALALVGLPLAWVARSILGAGDSRAYSIALMLVALLLVVKWRSLLSLRLYGTALATVIPLLFLLPVLLLAIWYDPVGQVAQFVLYSLLLFLACQTVETYRFSSLPYALVTVATAVSAMTLAFYAFVLGGFDSDVTESGRLTAGHTDNPNFVAFAGGLGIVASMLLPRFSQHSWWTARSLLVGLCFSICVLAVLLSVTRSVYAGIALCASVALIARSRDQLRISSGLRSSLARLIVIAPVFAVVFWIAYVLLGEPLLEYPLITIQRSLLGVEGIISGTGGEDISSDTRFELRRQALEGLTIVGAGFDAFYVDFPILQAYYDLGILGGTTFLLIALVIPSIWAIKATLTANVVGGTVPLAYIYIYFFPNILLHGKPYDFAIWLPVLLAYIGMGRKRLAIDAGEPPLGVVPKGAL